MEGENKKYPEGLYLCMWMGIGVVIFSGIIIPLNIILNNYGFIGIGPAIGVVFELSIGQAVENKYKEDGKIRYLIEDDKKVRKNCVMAGFAILSLGVVVFLLLILY